MKASLILTTILFCFFITACEKYEEIDLKPDQMKSITKDEVHYRVIDNILGTKKGVVITYDTIGQVDSIYLKQGPVNGNYKLVKVALTQVAQYKNAMIGLGTDGVLYVATVQQDGASTMIYTKIPMDNPATIVSFSVNGNTIEAIDSYNNKYAHTGSSDSHVYIKAACAECSYMFGLTLFSVAVEKDKSNPDGKDIRLIPVKKQ